MGTDSLEYGRWAPWVRLTPEDGVRGEIAKGLSRASSEASVSITDLLDLRTAYYRRRLVVPIPPERAELLESGRELHAAFATAIAEPRFREVRLRRDGIVGQVDVLDRFPVELKTTSRLPDPNTLAADRPQYVEQLGMYCVLLGEPQGRLVVLHPQEGELPEIVVMDARFDNLDSVWEEMQRRAAALRLALERGDPSALPECAWRTRDCPFAAARACSCTGEEAPSTFSIREQLTDLKRNLEEEARIQSRLKAMGPKAPVVRRYRDLLYPRRTFFERTRAPTAASIVETRERPLGATQDLFRQLARVVETGLSEEAVGATALPPYPDEPILLYRDSPILARASRARPPRSIGEIAERAPQYLLELGLRCAAVGRSEGLLVVGYEKAVPPADPVQVARVHFDSVSGFARIAEERADALKHAIASGDPSGLLPCPAWMVNGCAYRDVCGCGSSL